MSHYCSVCCVYLSNPYKLKAHYSTNLHTKRAESQLKYVCNCGKSFTKSSNLSRHKKQCKYEEPPENVIQTLQERLHEKDQVTKEMSEKNAELKDQLKALASINNTRNNTLPSTSLRVKISPKLRTQIRCNQNNTCGICKKDISQVFQLDHTIALQFGGTNHEDNLMALCCECHAKKSMYELKHRKEIKEFILGLLQKYMPEVQSVEREISN